MCLILRNTNAMLGIYSSDRDYLVGGKRFVIKDGRIRPQFYGSKEYVFEDHDYGIVVKAKHVPQTVENQVQAHNGLTTEYVSTHSVVEGLGVHIYYIAVKNMEFDYIVPDYTYFNKSLLCYVLVNVCDVQLIGHKSAIVKSIILPEPSIQSELVETFCKTDKRRKHHISEFMEKYKEVYTNIKR